MAVIASINNTYGCELWLVWTVDGEEVFLLEALDLDRTRAPPMCASIVRSVDTQVTLLCNGRKCPTFERFGFVRSLRGRKEIMKKLTVSDSVNDVSARRRKADDGRQHLRVYYTGRKVWAAAYPRPRESIARQSSLSLCLDRPKVKTEYLWAPLHTLKYRQTCRKSAMMEDHPQPSNSTR